MLLVQEHSRNGSERECVSTILIRCYQELATGNLMFIKHYEEAISKKWLEDSDHKSMSIDALLKIVMMGVEECNIFLHSLIALVICGFLVVLINPCSM